MIKTTLTDKLGNPESSSINLLIVGEDLLTAFYKLLYLKFCDSSDQ